MAAGEYTLFGTKGNQGNDIFHIQGRLGPRNSRATFTLALAFGVPGEYAYQVCIILSVLLSALLWVHCYGRVSFTSLGGEFQ